MIETGDYTIINVQHQNLAYLADPNESPITANYEQNDMNEKVSISFLISILLKIQISTVESYPPRQWEIYNKECWQ